LKNEKAPKAFAFSAVLKR